MRAWFRNVAVRFELFAKNLIHATDKTQMLTCFPIVKNEAVTLPFPWKKIGLQINSAI